MDPSNSESVGSGGEEADCDEEFYDEETESDEEFCAEETESIEEFCGDETDSDEEFEKKKIVCFTAMLITVLLVRRWQRQKAMRLCRAPNTEIFERNTYLKWLIYDSDAVCTKMFRTERDTFLHLCEKLKTKGLLRDRSEFSVEEQVAAFLHILGHNTQSRVLKTHFFGSAQDTNKYFNEVLYAIGELRGEYMKHPNAETPEIIKTNPNFSPFFDDCIGAIGGTHVHATPPLYRLRAFRGPNGFATQHVLATVDFKLRFMYVLAGWEGSAHDQRVFNSAIEREDGIPIMEGKYYLADKKYSTRPGFISPFHGVRYDLKEFSNNPPSSDKELFNYRHAGLRTNVDQAFGALKNRFKILTSRSSFPFPTQVDIVLACCIIHNFIIIHTDGPDSFVPSVEEIENGEDNEMGKVPKSSYGNRTTREQRQNAREMVASRDDIMRQMWEQCGSG